MERFLAVVLVFSLLAPEPAEAEGNGAQSFFAQAYSRFTNNRLTEAEGLFLQTLQNNDILSDYSLYFLGQIAFTRGSLSAARRYLSRLKEEFPFSTWLAHADLLLAKIAAADRDYAQSTRLLQTLVNLDGSNEIACEARYRLGQIQESQGQVPQAYETYQQLRRAFPLCAWADAARKALPQLRDQDPRLAPELSYETLWDEGELLLRQRQYREAELAFQRLLQRFPDEALRPRSLMGLARVYNASRRRAEQIPLLAVIVNKYPRSAEAPLALHRLATIYWNRNDNLQAMAHFKRLIDRYPTNPSADTAAIAVARIEQSLGQYQQAINILQAFPSNFPASPLRGEAQWRLAWIYYTRADLTRAHGAFKDLAQAASADRYKPGALYWQGRSAEKMGRQEEAKTLYVAIVQDFEESFYAGSAARRLEAITGATADAEPVHGSVFAEPAVSASAAFHLSHARALAELSLDSLALVELDAVKNELTDSGSKLFLMREYARIGAYHRSVALASQFPFDSDAVRTHRYPLAYWDLVQQKAKETGLDPYLVLALIRQESLFDTHAVSPAHALGLMQLIPTTAARLAKQLGIPQPSAEKLFDPETNLTLGTFYLQELLRLYGNDPVKALAAYNAGEKAAARWESEISTDDPDEFVERITYRETLQYVKLVLRSQRLYRTIYAGHK